MIDRKSINQALSKALAYKECGKHDQAEIWVRILVERLECAGILTTHRLTPDPTAPRESIYEQIERNPDDD